MTTGVPSEPILGVPVSLVNPDLAAATIFGWIAARDGQFVCVRDVHGIMLAQDDAALRAVHDEAGMVVPDGMPLVHVLRHRGFDTVRRTSGADLVAKLCDEGRAHGIRHYFYGGQEGVAAEMATALSLRYPGLQVAGTGTPPVADAATLAAAAIPPLTAARADIVWVGLSTPKQEHWMRAVVDQLPGATLIGVGAAFDFHAGRVRRAPLWMQRATLEWLHRLWSEPRRLWRRYLVLAPRFLVALASKRG